MNQDAGGKNMPAKRKGWQDVDKRDIPVKQLIHSFLVSQEDQNHPPKTVQFIRREAQPLPSRSRRARQIGPQHRSSAALSAASREKGGAKFSQHAYMRSVKTF